MVRLRHEHRQEHARQSYWEAQARQAEARSVAAKQELPARREELQKAQAEEREAAQRRAALERERQALARGRPREQQAQPGSIGDRLDRLPRQWVIAVAAAAFGFVGSCGPGALHRFYLVLTGSGVGALLIVCLAWYSSSSEGWLYDPLWCLVYTDGCTFSRWLWALMLLLGLARWCFGFECALYAVVDEVQMNESASGRYLVDIQKDKLCELSGDEDEDEAEGVATYLVDNTELKSKAKFIAYRLSKSMEHKDEEHLAVYGSRVRGLDEGDGWLRVGRRYLPMQVRGVQVLILQQDPPAASRSNNREETGSSSAQRERNRHRRPRDREDGPATFEEFEKTATEMAEGNPPSRAELQQIWAEAGKARGQS